MGHSARLSNVNLFSSTATNSSSLSSGTGSEKLISIKLFSVILWCGVYQLLSFFRIHLFKHSPLPFFFFFFGYIHNPFHDLFDWLCNKSCEVTYNICTQFSPSETYWLGFNGFLCNNDNISKGVILDFHNTLLWISSIALANFSLQNCVCNEFYRFL